MGKRSTRGGGESAACKGRPDDHMKRTAQCARVPSKFLTSIRCLHPAQLRVRVFKDERHGRKVNYKKVEISMTLPWVPRNIPKELSNTFTIEANYGRAGGRLPKSSPLGDHRETSWWLEQGMTKKSQLQHLHRLLHMSRPLNSSH